MNLTFTFQFYYKAILEQLLKETKYPPFQKRILKLDSLQKIKHLLRGFK